MDLIIGTLIGIFLTLIAFSIYDYFDKALPEDEEDEEYEDWRD